MSERRGPIVHTVNRLVELITLEMITGQHQLIICLFCGQVCEAAGKVNQYCSQPCQCAAYRARKRLVAHPPAERVYIRYGEWNRQAEISYDHRSGIPVAEPGVSCLDAYFDKRGGCYRLDTTYAQHYLRPLHLFLLFLHDQPIYIITGKIVGRGSGNEPCLRQVRIVSPAVYVNQYIVPCPEAAFTWLHGLSPGSAVGVMLVYHDLQRVLSNPLEHLDQAALQTLHQQQLQYQRALSADTTRSLSAAHIRARLVGKIPSRTDLARYKPADTWYLRPDGSSGVHGINHAARVLVWQEVLARLQRRKGVALDQEALRWAAVTHDTQRAHDGPDLEHGARAADWIGQQFQGTIAPRSLETAAYLNRWHVPSDASAPTMTPELAVFKDADALDRVRIGGFHPEGLRVPSSRGLIPLARALHKKSAELQEIGLAPFDCVLAAAEALGLLTAK